ncbi:hypothetical protein ACH5RR_020781 [Cinchona calisaya]|uniref:Metallothionein-like protein n=1 Tax=Cinchona calisaya TaxID=153742 RepID=A0ABD2ZJ93_9GENT
MSSWGKICTCGAGCKRETGCRGFGREHEMEVTTSTIIISGIAPVNNDSMGTKKSFGAEDDSNSKCSSCNYDPCSC